MFMDFLSTKLKVCVMGWLYLRGPSELLKESDAILILSKTVGTQRGVCVYCVMSGLVSWESFAECCWNWIVKA